MANQKVNNAPVVADVRPPTGYFFFMAVVAVVIVLVVVFLVLSYFA